MIARPQFKYDCNYKYERRLPDEINCFAVAIDETGNIYISDLTPKVQQVRGYTPDGTPFRTIPGTDFDPIALGFDASGNLLILDYDGQRVVVIDAEDNVKHSLGEFLKPRGITTDNEFNVVVADSNRHQIQIFDPKGVWLRQFGSEGEGPGQMKCPIGVGVTIEGNIVVAEKDNSRLQVFTAFGQSLRILGSYGSGYAEFNSPWGICVDKNGTIAVADQCNRRIQFISSDGEYVMVIDRGEAGSILSYPMAVALDSNGALFVCDRGNSAVLILE